VKAKKDKENAKTEMKKRIDELKALIEKVIN